MTDTPAITIPRLPNEPQRAYQARVRYITMGAGRSIEKAAQSNTKTIPHYKAWSVKYGWVESANHYDQTLATLAAQRHAAEYQAAIEAQRGEASKIGGELIAMGRAIAAEIARRRDVMDYKPADLAVAVKAILAGFDLRAHALDLDKLLPALLEGGDDA